MKYILMHRETVVAVPADWTIRPRPQGACQESESLVGRTYHPCQPFGISPCAGGFAGSEEVTAVRQHFDDEVLCTKPVRSILAQSCRTATGMEQGQFL